MVPKLILKLDMFGKHTQFLFFILFCCCDRIMLRPAYSFIYSNSRLTIQHIRSIVTSGVTIEIYKTHGMLCMTSSITMVTTNTTYRPMLDQDLGMILMRYTVFDIEDLFYNWWSLSSVKYNTGKMSKPNPE